MDRSELESLGVSTDIVTACRALGISKSAGYMLAREEKFPVPVIRVGGRYTVPTAGLRKILGLDEVVAG